MFFIKGLTLGLLLSIAGRPHPFYHHQTEHNSGVRGGLAFVAGVSLSDVGLAVASNFFTEVFNTLIERKELVAIIGSVFLISVGVFFFVL
jgi:cytochrome c biogenesis protein CcdA